MEEVNYKSNFYNILKDLSRQRQEIDEIITSTKYNIKSQY